MKTFFTLVLLLLAMSASAQCFSDEEEPDSTTSYVYVHDDTLYPVYEDVEGLYVIKQDPEGRSYRHPLQVMDKQRTPRSPEPISYLIHLKSNTK